jgi:endonuclease/exonuclease/phosphatase family metal-dependent hydrolase
VLTWNLFHGRDAPPDPSLQTWRSRLLRITERNATHVQVNRELLAEFAGLLGEADWDIALLQECPPRWATPLARACAADVHVALTSRNGLALLRSTIARLNPDLIASNEGGSNLTLARRAAAKITERRTLELRPGPKPERRAMAFTRIALADGELCVANLHASAGRANRVLAEQEVLLAAAKATQWARAAPLVFGGDLNLRPAETSVYEALRERFGLTGATGPNSLDHVLARDLAEAEAARQWSPERREIQSGERAIRLSDHAPVEASYAIHATRGA